MYDLRDVFIPRYVFFTKGVGHHPEKLASFEFALRSAGIAPFNLIQVSSILPPGVKQISASRGLKMLNPGQLVFSVISKNFCDEYGRLISASVGCAKPLTKKDYGYLTEVHKEGFTERETRDWAEDTAAELLATTYGIEIKDEDWNRIWDTKREVYVIGKRPVETRSVCAVARGQKDKFTTVIAAAVFVP